MVVENELESSSETDRDKVLDSERLSDSERTAVADSDALDVRVGELRERVKLSDRDIEGLSEAVKETDSLDDEESDCDRE